MTDTKADEHTSHLTLKPSRLKRCAVQCSKCDMTAQTEPEAGIAQLPPDDRPLCGVRAFAGGPLPRGPGPKEPEVRRCLKGDRCRDAASEIGVLPRPSSSNPSKSCNMHDMGCVRPMWVQVSTCEIPTVPRTRMHGNESYAAVAHAACFTQHAVSSVTAA